MKRFESDCVVMWDRFLIVAIVIPYCARVPLKPNFDFVSYATEAVFLC